MQSRGFRPSPSSELVLVFIDSASCFRFRPLLPLPFCEHHLRNHLCLYQSTLHVCSDGEDVGWASASGRTKRLMALVPSSLNQRVDPRCQEAAGLLQSSLCSRSGSPYIQRRELFLSVIPVSQLMVTCSARQSLGHLSLALRRRILVPQLWTCKAPIVQEHGLAPSQSRAHSA